MSNLCPKCGAELFEGGRFCMVCGLPLDGAQPQPMPRTQAPPQPQQMPQTQAPPQPQQMPMQQPPMPQQPMPPQEQKPHNMTQEFIERRKREKGIY